jgi:hypothetical protein
MMPFFFTIPIRRMMPMMPITSSGIPNSISVNKAPSPAEGKVEMIVRRMDRALVEHAEDDIDRDQGSHNQDGRAAERTLEGRRPSRQSRKWPSARVLRNGKVCHRRWDAYGKLRSKGRRKRSPRSSTTSVSDCSGWRFSKLEQIPVMFEHSRRGGRNSGILGG